MPQKIVLKYFDVRGAGEAIRLTLHYGGIPFEDRRIPLPGKDNTEWTEMKPKTPFGQLPILEVDGKEVTQTAPILHYVAKLAGIAGRDDWEQLKVMEIGEYTRDVGREISKYFQALVGMIEGDVDKLKTETFLPAATKYFAKISELLKKNGSGFIVGEKPTSADLGIAEFLKTLRNFGADITAYPDLIAYIDRVLALPQIQEYVKSRKDSQL